MRTIIAGSRTATEDDVNSAMDQCPWTCDISIVISGKAKGADLGGEKWAKRNNIPVEEYPADWNRILPWEREGRLWLLCGMV